MTSKQKTVIVTGASQGIGAGVVQAFLARGYNVVGTSRSATKSKELSASDHLALIDGDIGQFETAQKSGGSIVSIIIGTIALVPQVVDAVKLPVVAAGGIADARGIVAAFALGASGVQMISYQNLQIHRFAGCAPVLLVACA